MNQATPAIRDLARLLLNLEAMENEQGKLGAHATASAIAKLRWHLTKLVGLTGFEALLARALALAKKEVRWFEALHVKADATLEGFQEVSQQQSAEAIVEGSVALLGQLLGLLVTFIGEDLTLRLVRDVWPEIQLDNLNSGTEETPA